MADAGGARFIKDEKKMVSTRKLKQNELSMITIIAIIAVAALGVYFVLLPMFTNMGALTDEIDQLKAKEYEFKNQIAQTELYQQQYQEAQDDYYKFFTYFYSPMDPEIVDERITSMLLAHEMTPASLNMTTLSVEVIPPYYAQELRANPLPESTDPQDDTTDNQASPADDMAGEGDLLYDTADDAAQAVEGASYAFVYTINVSAYGERDNLYTFLAQAAPMTAMHIISFDFSDPVTTSADGTATTTPGQINMEIKMYVLIDGVPARDFGAGDQ